MIKSVTNSEELMQAFNENFNALLSGDRKLPFAKEVNNTLGKMSNEIRNRLIYKTFVGDRSDNLEWYSKAKQISIEDSPSKIMKGKLKKSA